MRYFNDIGKTILGQAVQGIEEDETKTECQTLVNNLENNHSKFIPRIEKQSEKLENYHQVILNRPVFREYKREVSGNRNEQPTFSLKQLFQLESGTLMSMVFVLLSHESVADSEGSQ